MFLIITKTPSYRDSIRGGFCFFIIKYKKVHFFDFKYYHIFKFKSLLFLCFFDKILSKNDCYKSVTLCTIEEANMKNCSIINLMENKVGVNTNLNKNSHCESIGQSDETWSQAGWNNSTTWSHEGWNNSTTWVQDGWCNGSMWLHEGWNNSTMWSLGGWNNSQ